MGGYLARRALDKHSCDLCEKAMCREEKAVGSVQSILTGLKSYAGVEKTDVGSLKPPTSHSNGL